MRKKYQEYSAEELRSISNHGIPLLVGLAWTPLFCQSSVELAALEIDWAAPYPSLACLLYSADLRMTSGCLMQLCLQWSVHVSLCNQQHGLRDDVHISSRPLDGAGLHPGLQKVEVLQPS